MIKYRIQSRESGNVITYDLRRDELIRTLDVYKKYDGDDWDAEFYEVVAYEGESTIARWDADGNMIDILDDYTVNLAELKVYIETAEWEKRKKVTKNKMDMDELIKISTETGNKNLDEIYWKNFHKE